MAIHSILYLVKMSAFWTLAIHLILYLVKMSAFWTLYILHYCLSGHKPILRFHHKFIWRLLTMFSTNKNKLVNGRRKVFFRNISNMHAWLNVRATCQRKSASLPLRVHAPISHWHSQAPDTQASLEPCTHIQAFWQGWPDQAPTLAPWLEAKVPLDLGGIVFTIWYSNGKRFSNVSTLKLLAMSDSHTTNDPPLPIGGATGHIPIVLFQSDGISTLWVQHVWILHQCSLSLHPSSLIMDRQWTVVL